MSELADRFPMHSQVLYDRLRRPFHEGAGEVGTVAGYSTSAKGVYVQFDDGGGAKYVDARFLHPMPVPALPEPVTIPVADPLSPMDDPRPGRSLLPLSEDEADLIRALRGDDVALTRTRVRRAVTDWFNEGDPLLNEQIESLTDRIVVAIERKS